MTFICFKFHTKMHLDVINFSHNIFVVKSKMVKLPFLLFATVLVCAFSTQALLHSCPYGYKLANNNCWPTCPKYFQDDGVYCRKPEAYARGVGHATMSLCETVHGVDACEPNNGLFYAMCRPGFRAVGCCVCSPTCPNGMKDMGGASCQKNSFPAHYSV
jgi:hypothetical protein